MPLSHATKFMALTPTQHVAFGRIVTEWSNVEFLVETLLIRLSCAPDFLGLALTNDLNISNRISCLKNLIKINRHRYTPPRLSDDIERRLNGIILEISRLKDYRNRFVHYCWCRDNDEVVFGIRFRAKLPELGKPNANTLTLRVAKMNELADRMHKLVEDLNDVLRLIPEIEEEWLMKELVKANRWYSK